MTGFPRPTAARAFGTVRDAAVLLAAMALAACGSGDDGAVRGERLADRHAAVVAGDDPRSVLTARDALLRGGTAADAAVSYFFMASVTYPSSASLAAGGTCINYDEGEDKAQLIDFRGVRAGRSLSGAALPVPGAVRGMAALHAVSGSTPWPDLVAPAERAARFGVAVSRALAADLRRGGAALLGDAAARRIFVNPDGSLPGEGDELVQLELAALLSRIRKHGVREFHAGPTALRLVEAAGQAGFVLAPEDLRDHAPAWCETRSFELARGLFDSGLVVHLPGEGFDSGHSTLAALAHAARRRPCRGAPRRHGRPSDRRSGPAHRVAEDPAARRHVRRR